MTSGYLRGGTQELRLLSVTVLPSPASSAGRVHGCRLSTRAWLSLAPAPLALDPVRAAQRFGDRLQVAYVIFKAFVVRWSGRSVSGRLQDHGIGTVVSDGDGEGIWRALGWAADERRVGRLLRSPRLRSLPDSSGARAGRTLELRTPGASSGSSAVWHGSRLTTGDRGRLPRSLQRETATGDRSVVTTTRIAAAAVHMSPLPGPIAGCPVGVSSWYCSGPTGAGKGGLWQWVAVHTGSRVSIPRPGVSSEVR